MDAKEIKELRQNLGLTQKEMAKALGCSINSVEHYEQGFRKPSKLFADKLEAARNIYLKKARQDKRQAKKFTGGNDGV